MERNQYTTVANRRFSYTAFKPFAMAGVPDELICNLIFATSEAVQVLQDPAQDVIMQVLKSLCTSSLKLRCANMFPSPAIKST